MSRDLFVGQGDVVSCPGGFINTNIPANSLPRIRSDSDGRSVYLLTCRRGFVASHQVDSQRPRELTVQCRKDSSGNITAPTDISCVPASCKLDALSSIKHAKLSLSNTSVPVDSAVTIVCDEGYTIDGISSGPTSRQLTCDQNANLSPLYSANDCQAVACGSLGVPDNAHITSDHKVRQKVFYGDVVQFQCNAGFFYHPSASTKLAFSLTCDRRGYMVSPEDPSSLIAGRCIPLHCGVIPQFSGSDPIARSTSTVGIGDVVKYVCARGAYFSNSTSSSSAVVSKSHWSNSISSMLPKISSFSVTCVYDSLQETAVYDTDPSIARCEAEPCPPPNFNLPLSVVVSKPPPPAGHIYRVGDVVSFACAQGYLLYGQPSSVPPNEITAECTSEKKWVLSDGFEACKIGQCKMLSDILPSLLANILLPVNSDLSKTLKIGDSIPANCDSGYVGGGVKIFCDETGNFAVSGKCLRQCGPLPPLPLNATLLGYDKDRTSYVPGGLLVGNVTFSCIKGHTVDGKITSNANSLQTLSCSGNANNFFANPFNVPVSSLRACQPVQCGMPPAIPNAHWYLSGQKISLQYFYGQNLLYSCNQGMGVEAPSSNGAKLFSSNTVQANCTENGWSLSATACSLVTCSNEPVLAHARIISGNEKPNLLVGDLIKIQCDPGFAAPGHHSNDTLGLTCQNNGDFSPGNYRSDMCRPIVCPPLPNTVLGALKPRSDVESLSYTDQPVEYTCNADWKLPPIKVSCNEDGNYLVEGSECVKPVCKTLPPGLANSVLASTAMASLHSITTVGCSSGFTTTDFSIQYQVECMGPGIWMPLNTAYSSGCPLPVSKTDPIVVG